MASWGTSLVFYDITSYAETKKLEQDQTLQGWAIMQSPL